MPVIRWLAHVVRSAYHAVIALAIAVTLFVVSAVAAASSSPEGTPFVRAIAAVFAYAAVTTFVVRGLLRRPPRQPSKTAVSGAEAAKSTVGCLAHLAAVAATYVVGGMWADHAWAAYNGDDPAHPVRQWVDRAWQLLDRVIADPEAHVPSVMVGVVLLIGLYGLASAIAGPTPRAPAPGASGATTGPRTRRAQARTQAARTSVAAANERALKDARRAASERARSQGRRQVLDDKGAQAVQAAHREAHRVTPVVPHQVHDLSVASNADAVLGRVEWIDGAWWARRDGDRFPIRIDGPRDGPSTAQFDLARQAAMRDFEVTLRAADAVRAVATDRGVGLPRFTITALLVGAANGGTPPVTAFLRCDGDPGHDYVARSTDGMQRFQAQ